MKTTLTTLLAGVTLALSLGAGGCVVHGSAAVSTEPGVVEVDEAPPADQVEVEATTSRPGFVWMNGHWARHGSRWDWQAGHWERERAGQAWQAGRWEQRGNRHVWVEGSWHSGGPVVRDHREEHHEETGPVIRDHRSN